MQVLRKLIWKDEKGDSIQQDGQSLYKISVAIHLLSFTLKQSNILSKVLIILKIIKICYKETYSSIVK